MKKLLLHALISISIFLIPISCSALEHKNDIQKGINYIDSFQFQKAINHFSTLIEKGKKDEIIYFYLGEAIRLRIFFSRYKELTEEKESELMKQAESAYLKSLEISPSYSDSEMGLGKLYYRNKDYTTALELFFKIESDGIKNPEVYEEIGNCYLAQNKIQLAREYFIKGGIKQRLGFEKGKKSTLVIDEEYSIDDQKIMTKSTLIWEISDPIIFIAQNGNMDTAASRVHDLYYAALLLSLPIDITETLSIEENNKNQIREMCNSKLKLFGMQITRIKEIAFRT